MNSNIPVHVSPLFRSTIHITRAFILGALVLAARFLRCRDCAVHLVREPFCYETAPLCARFLPQAISGLAGSIRRIYPWPTVIPVRGNP